MTRQYASHFAVGARHSIAVAVLAAAGACSNGGATPDAGPVGDAGERDAGVSDANLPPPPDTTPPAFAGIASIRATAPDAAIARWNAATDDRSAQAALIYLIYVATRSGGQDFGTPTLVAGAGGTDATIAGLAPGGSYFVVVRAQDEASNIDTNRVERLVRTPATPDATPPTFAGATGVSAVGDSAIRLTWAPGSDDRTPTPNLRYVAYLATTAGAQDFSNAGATSAEGAPSMEVSGLVSDTTYYAVVRARDDAGNTDQNRVEVSATTAQAPDSTPPTFAGATVMRTVSATDVDLEWAAAADDRSPQAKIEYLAYLATNPGGQAFAAPTATSAPGATSLRVTGLRASSRYWAVVRARDEAGNIDANRVEVAGATLDTTPPTFAGAVSAVSNSPSTMDVSWNAATDNITPAGDLQYLAYLALSPGGQSFAVAYAASQKGWTTLRLLDLKSSTPYYVVVRAQDMAGNLDANVREVSATTLRDLTPPTFAGATAAVAGGTTTVDVTWAAGSDDVSDPDDIVYHAYLATISGAQNYFAPTATSPPGATSLRIGNLAPDNPYYIVVRAQDEAGNRSPVSREVQTRTLAVVDTQPPTFAGATGAQAMTTTGTGLQVSWSAGSDNQTPAAGLTYLVYVAAASGGQDFATPPAVASVPGAASAAVPELRSRTTYYVVVRARDGSGNTDVNTVEVSGATGDIRFGTDIDKGIWQQHDATCHHCHTFTYSSTVGVAPTLGGCTGSPFKLIDPGKPSDSIMVQKVTGLPRCGSPMPPQGPLPPFLKDALSDWVAQGAPNN